MEHTRNFSERASQTSQEIQNSAREVAGSVRELLSSLTEVTRNEISLFKVEMRHEREVMTRNLLSLGVATVFGGLAMLALMSFCIIGLGELLNYNYWASSLIVFGVFTVIAVILGAYAYNKLLSIRNSFGAPRTATMLRQETEALESKVKDISDAVKRRRG